MQRFSQRKLLSMGTKVIAVRIGKEPSHVDFTVHEDLIRRSSSLFEAALSRDWIQSQERVVKLPERDIDAFQIYIQWLYTDRLHTETEYNPSKVPQGDEWDNLVRGYLLGEYLQDVEYKDTVSDAMMDYLREASIGPDAPPIVDAAKKIFPETTAVSPIRKMLADFAVWEFDMGFWMQCGKKLPKEFLEEATVGLAERLSHESMISPFSAQKRGACHYHGHGAKKKCYREKIKSYAEPCSSSGSEATDTNEDRDSADVSILEPEHIDALLAGEGVDSDGYSHGEHDDDDDILPL